MCLGIPGKITAITDAARLMVLADVSGVRRKVNVAFITEAGREIAQSVDLTSDCAGLGHLMQAAFATAPNPCTPRATVHEAALPRP